ncbi:MAG TPA: D-glycerate dehydrogenase [Chitinophagaceae bacterium]|nr:D-glycerate dehydrogenase [Chitinophagaceae bacterium]
MIKDPQQVRVFVTRDLPGKGVSLLQKEGFTVSVWPHDRPMSPAELIEEGKKANAILTLLTDVIDAGFLNACKQLDIISQFAVGYDNINIPEATKLGIAVGYTPGAMSDATADTAFGLMIAVSRKMFYMHKKIAKGEWTFFRPKANLGIELKNKTLGILGLGRIGMQMALRCKGAYNMKIIYHNRKPNKDAEKILGATLVSFDELLAQSDVVTVHCALNNETRGIFDQVAFSKMKPTSIFVNTARGGVHNEKDLIEAVNVGKIWGAGLDVTNPEPMDASNPLLSMPNVAVLPHIGSQTEEARGEMSRLAAMNIIEFYKNNRIPNVVNPETLTMAKSG